MTIIEPTTQAIRTAAAELKQGHLIAFPTETVYGLGALATDDNAVASVFAAKNRPQFNPLISHVYSVEQAQAYGHFTSAACHLADAFWPGPLTIIVDRSAGCMISLLASAGGPTMAIRMPSHPVALELLRHTDVPVVAPSANPSGRISPSTAAHVDKYMSSHIKFVLDGGECECGLESTVIDCRNPDQLVVLRPGPITPEMVTETTGYAVTMPTISNDSCADTDIISPGQLSSHYAPRARLRLNVTNPNDDEVMIGFGDMPHISSDYNLSLSGDVTEAAANLFKMLHSADDTGASAIAVAPIPQTGIGMAINDRLARAAAPK